MERLEIVTVVLIAVGSLLIANPAFTNAQEATQGTVEITAEPMGAEAGDLDAVAASSRQVLYNPNVTLLSELAPRERDLIRQAAQAGGAVNMSRAQYNRTFANVTDLSHLQPGGHVYGNGTLLRPRLGRAQGGLLYTLRPITQSVVVGDREAIHPEADRWVTAARREPVALNASTAILTIYDYVIDDETVLAPTVSRVGDGDGNASGDSGAAGNASLDPNGSAMLTLEERSPTAFYERISVALEDLPPLRQRQVQRAIDDGRYDTGNLSVGPLQRVETVRSDGDYYRLGFESRKPNLLEMMSPGNIAGLLLGFIFLISGLYYGREVYREKTAAWE